jgi:hypothetical protein
MNDHDKHNLNFLLNASPATLQDWYMQMDSDDHAYATELLQQAKVELDMYAAEHFDEVEDLTLASEVLKKFRK